MYPTSGGYKVSHGEIVREPDFVNTQAVHARVLAQILAYPFMTYVMKDILDESDRSCNVVIHPASNFIPLDEPLKMGVVKEMVEMTPGERSIMIGYTDHNGELFIIPHHSLERTFTKHDNLILMRVVLPRVEARERLSWTKSEHFTPRDSFVTWNEIDGVNRSDDICDATANCICVD